jgi:hypothetical protein
MTGTNALIQINSDLSDHALYQNLLTAMQGVHDNDYFRNTAVEVLTYRTALMTKQQGEISVYVPNGKSHENILRNVLTS